MSLTRNRPRPALLVLAVLVCGPALGAPADPRAAGPVKPIPFADGVLGPARRTAYVSGPKGGIQAIRLEDGKVLWANDCKGRPWLVAGRRLIARGDRLTVLDLDNKGKVVRQSDTLPYPKVAAPERCTVAFYLWRPRVVGDTLEARWFAVASIDRSKGRPFAFAAWTAFNKAAPVGTVTFNLSTGRVALQTGPAPANVTMGLVPEAAKPENQVPPGLPAKLAAVWRQYHKEQNGRIALLGQRLVGVSMTVEPAGADFVKKVTLSSWDVKTGAASAPVELVKDRAINIATVVLTEDRRHAGVVFGTSALAVYSLADGKRVGNEVKGVVSPERAFVQGKRLYHARLAWGRPGPTPSSLEALDLESGKLLWQRPLQTRSTILLPP